jgi:hypothetical protein
METFPKELINIIIEYDGRIKYRNGKYINVIHPHDTRYDLLTPIIEKKIHILTTVMPLGTYVPSHPDDFFFEFNFNKEPKIGLSYANGGYSGASYSNPNKLEITYFSLKNNIIQSHRTYM